MSVAPLRADEAAAAVALWHAAGVARPWNDPHADLALALADPAAEVLAAHDAAGALVGTAMVGFDGHRGWVYYLAVAAEQRRQGVGRALMAEAETWLRDRGAPKLQLMVRDDNPAATGFYAALGYAEQDVRVLGRRLDGG